MNIKIAAIFLIALSSASASMKERLDCDKFRTGTFYNKKDGVINTKITRTAEYQIEEYYKYNAKAKFNITWTSKCTYELTFDSGNEEARKMITDPSKRLFVEIIKTTNDTYTIDGWMEGRTQKYRSELTKVSE